MHLLHKTPPKGLSGLFFVLAMLLILNGSSRGTPFNAAPQLPHLAAFGFLFLKWTLVLPPETFLNTFLRLLDLNLGAGMPSGNPYLFIKVSIIFKYKCIKANAINMFKILISKKGVSPLIATILLIAFAVALGSVVMNWGLNLNLGKSSDKCRNVEIKIRSVDVAEVCFGGLGANGYINFIIDNTGSQDISGLAIWIIGGKGTRLFDLDNVLIKKNSLYDKKDKEVTYDFTTFGNIKQAQFIPKVRTEQMTDICTKKAIIAEKIGVCS